MQNAINTLQNTTSPITHDPFYLISGLIAGFVVGIIIATVYKKTNRSLTYSVSFAQLIVLMLPVIIMIIMFVSTNLARAIGVFGAFSVIRFRTTIRDSRDMFFLFWVLATGLVIGAGYMALGILSVLVVTAMVYLLYRFNFGFMTPASYMISCTLRKNEPSLKRLQTLLGEYARRQEVISVQTMKDSNEAEVTISVDFKKGVSIEEVSHMLAKHRIFSIHIAPTYMRQLH